MPDPLSVFDDYVLGLVWAHLDVHTRFVASNVSSSWRASQRPGWKRAVLGSSLAEDRRDYYLDLERSGGAVDWRRLAITHSVRDKRWAACRAGERWVTAPSHCVDYLSPTFHDVYNGSIVYVAGGAEPGGFNTFGLDTQRLTTASFDIPPDTLDAQDVRGAGVAFLRGEEISVTRGSLCNQIGHVGPLPLCTAVDILFDPRTEATNDAHVVSDGEYAMFRYVVGPNREGQFCAVESTAHRGRKMDLQLPYDMPYASMCPTADFLLLYGTSLAIFDRASRLHLTSVFFTAPAPIGAVFDLALSSTPGGGSGAPIRVSVRSRAMHPDETALAPTSRPRLGGIAEVSSMDGGILLLRGTQGDVVLIRDYAQVFHAAAALSDDDAATLIAGHSILLKLGYDDAHTVAVHTHGPRLLIVAPHATVCIDTRDLPSAVDHAQPLPVILLPTPNQNDHRPLPLSARATIDGRGIYQTVPLRGLRKEAYIAASNTNPGMVKWQDAWDTDIKKRPYFAIRAWSFEPEQPFPEI